MSLSNTALIVVSSLLVLGLTSLLSIYFAKKTKSSEDWAVGGRSLPLYVIIGTQYATAMGGGILVAHVGIGYKSGWSVLTYGVFVSGTLIILTLIAKWLREQQFTTVPDIIQRFYGKNKVLLTIASLMTIIVPFGWICTQLVAFGKLYSSLTGIPMNTLMIVFAIISLAFVLPAGLTSVAWTDFIFGCLMLVMSMLSIFYVVKMGGGWSHITANVPSELWQFPKGMGAVGTVTILLWALSILPGGLTNQCYYQRIFAVDDVKKVKISLVISAIVIFTAEIWAGFMGISIRSINPKLAPEMASGWFLTQVPVWFLMLYSGFLVATIMSTIDSAVQSVVVNITRDIYSNLMHPEGVDDKKLLRLSRTLSVIVTFLGLSLAILYPQALNWLVASYAYSAAALLFPIFMGYFLKDKKFLTSQGAIASMIFGVIGCAIAQISKVKIPYVGYGLVGSLIGLIVVSYFTRNKFYSNFEETI